MNSILLSHVLTKAIYATLAIGAFIFVSMLLLTNLN
jgi:hypothetical protein